MMYKLTFSNGDHHNSASGNREEVMYWLTKSFTSIFGLPYSIAQKRAQDAIFEAHRDRFVIENHRNGKVLTVEHKKV